MKKFTRPLIPERFPACLVDRPLFLIPTQNLSTRR